MYLVQGTTILARDQSIIKLKNGEIVVLNKVSDLYEICLYSST